MNAILMLKPKATVAFLYSDCSVRQGLEKMRAHGFASIPVISRKGQYCGSITEGDFLWYLIDNRNAELKFLETSTIDDVVRRDFNPPVKVDVDVNELIDRALTQNFIPVVDDRNLFIGIITRQDIIRYFSEKIST